MIAPKINLRVSKNTQPERFTEATKLTKAGLGFPQYSNDDVVIPALEKMGYEHNDAANYTVAACWEFIIPNVGADIANISALSYPSAVDKALHNGLTECDSYDDSFGGFTFSGGEPLAQAEFLFVLSEELKDYHLCIETSGYANENVFRKAVNIFDFIIMDIKLADSEEHIKYTGVGNSRILQNFEILKASGKPYLIRTPLIPRITDTEENLSQVKKLIGDSQWEQLPYNKMAGAKYKMLNMKFEL